MIFLLELLLTLTYWQEAGNYHQLLHISEEDYSVYGRTVCISMAA